MISKTEALAHEQREKAARIGLKRMMEKVGLKDDLNLNTSNEVVFEHVEANIRLGFPQVRNYDLQGKNAVIVGGGWSLEETEQELIEMSWDPNTRVIACNGAANWLIERNIKPDAVVLLDARPTNIKFVMDPIPDCKYFLASQCHPSIFERCKDRDVQIFHCVSSGIDEERELLDNYYAGNWLHIPGTCCVGFRALVLMRYLGYRYFDLFGMDSCYKDDGTHHAYRQPENEGEDTGVINVGGRPFRVSAWQFVQAVDFQALITRFGREFQIRSHGDGLISYMLQYGSSLTGDITEMGLEEILATEGD